MNRKPLAFGEWTPDAGLTASSANEAKGVYSYGGRYMPLRGTTRYSDNARMSDRCLGHFGARQSGGQVRNFFGDRQRLYHLLNRSMLDLSKPGGYAADGDHAWTFDQFNNYIVATCRGAPAQYYLMGTSETFADIGNDAGEGDACGRIGFHMLIAQGAEMRVSAFNNPTMFTPSTATQAGKIPLDQRGGLVQRIVGGAEAGAVFQEKMISRWSYTGAPFQVDPVEKNRGCLGPHAVASLGRLTYYVSEDGVFVFDGMQSVPIGANKIDRYFTSKLNYSYRNRISMAIDTDTKCVQIAFPTGNSADLTETLIYSIPDQRWSHDEFTGQMLFEIPKEGVSIDDLATIQSKVGTTNLDEIHISIDSPIWRETRKLWGAVDLNRYVGIFDGPTRPAELETVEREIKPGVQSTVTELMPITDAPSQAVTTQVAVKQRLFGDPVVYSDRSQMTPYGKCHFRSRGRYLRARLSIAGGAEWSETIGLHVNPNEAGER